MNAKKVRKVLLYLFLIVLAFIMVYPIAWLITSSFKENSEIFTSTRLLPRQWNGFNAFIEGWKGTGQNTFTVFFKNSFLIVIPTVIFTVCTSLLTAYGFARFKFRYKKILFSLMIATLLLPNEVLIVPRYIMFNRFGWINTLKPFYMPAVLGTYSFFIFMMFQFIRSIPKVLDEVAYLDGCNTLDIFFRIIVPLSGPSIVSMTLLQFIWRWNDFFDSLIYINSVKKFPVALGLRLALDVGEAVSWNETMAMTTLSILPPIILYATCQRYFVEGITTTGIKG